MKELYSQILFDDGKAPKKFEKDHLVVDRSEINALLNKDVRISSRNLRTMKTGPLAMVKKNTHTSKCLHDHVTLS